MKIQPWLLGWCVLVSACSFEDRHEACEGSQDCGPDRACYQGFCVRSDDALEHELKVTAPDSGARATLIDAGPADAGRRNAGAKEAAAGEPGAAGAAAGRGGEAAPKASSQPDSAAADSGARPGRPPAADGGGAMSPAADGGQDGLDAAASGESTTRPPACEPRAETCNGADDDCDGKVDNGFNLKRDQNNCGACGHKCSGDEVCRQGECTAEKGQPNPPSNEPKGCKPECGAGQTCCGNTCIDTSSDANNCGMCGNACTAGAKPGCCDGRCVDLVTNQNCGACGHDCSLLSNGGITCSCQTSAEGNIACTGPLLNLCL